MATMLTQSQMACHGVLDCLSRRDDSALPEEEIE
jgi:hypothetical protein